MIPTIITTDNRYSFTNPANGKDFKLKELQAVVEGYIELVHLSDKVVMVVNEEGKCDNLEPNSIATAIARKVGAIPLNDYIAGNVLVCDDAMVK